MILVDENTKLLVQGITGTAGTRHTKTMLEYGTKVVAGVRPGAGGQSVEGVPVFNDAKSAVGATGANAAIMFLSAAIAKGVAIDTINSGVKLLVIIPEGVPLHDTIEVLEYARQKGVRIVGPNTAGLIAPSAKCKIGFVPNMYFVPGNVGLISRSGTLTYEMASRLTLNGIGQSTAVGVGGDPIVGTRIPELMGMFENDKETDAVLVVGEIGGNQEEEAAQLVSDGKFTKPVVAFIAGYSAPAGKRIGHAGAIISGGKGTIESKLSAFRDAGINVAKTPGEAIDLMKKFLKK